MLENDPYAMGNMAVSRKLKGKDQSNKYNDPDEELYEGIDWGISD